jgi:XTP/dITP diphosphohydrolase
VSDRAPALPADPLRELVAVMDRLRSPGGCAWDAEQTHASLAPYALEEAHEVVEAIEAGTAADLREELGDLLLQVVFHARVAQDGPEADRFDVDDVAAGVTAKLVHRHPHVFAAAEGADPLAAADVEAGWEARKRQEKQRDSAFDGVPVALPALARAAKVLGRARRADLDVAPLLPGPDADDLGDRLLAVVAGALADDPRADPEAALRAAVRRLEESARADERAAAARHAPSDR